MIDCSVPQGSVLGPQEFSAYTEELASIIEQYCAGYHFYADDIQLIEHCRPTDVPKAKERLLTCVQTTQDFCMSRRLQLNPVKTELIWFGTKASLKKLEHIDTNLEISSNITQSSAVVRDLGVWLDSELSMTPHIKKVVASCFYQLRRLKHIRRVLGQQVTANLVTAFISSKLDYCNSLLAGLPETTIAQLQRVQNAAVRLVARLRPHDHVTLARRSLHWLPVKYRITYKLCVLMHQVHVGRSPTYLSKIVTATSNLPGRSHLRSASSLCYDKPRLNLKFGRRSFSYAGPAAWNTLLVTIQELTNTATFKRNLKTYLFALAYDLQLYILS
jgi:hypothetical protein